MRMTPNIFLLGLRRKVSRDVSYGLLGGCVAFSRLIRTRLPLPTHILFFFVGVRIHLVYPIHIAEGRRGLEIGAFMALSPTYKPNKTKKDPANLLFPPFFGIILIKQEEYIIHTQSLLFFFQCDFGFIGSLLCLDQLMMRRDH